MLGRGLAACLHGRSVSLGAAEEGACSQRPPVFSPVYFNKINLTKESLSLGGFIPILVQPLQSLLLLAKAAAQR